MFKNYTAWWSQTPLSIRQFLLKGLLILVVWKIAYVLYLGPSGLLDKPLTALVGEHTSAVLNFLSTTANYSHKQVRFTVNDEPDQLGEPVNAVIFYFGKPLLTIAHACNGLELFVLYTGFLICMPASFIRLILYLLTGTLLIYGMNVMRCAGLALLSNFKPGMLDFAHHYLFKIILYSIIFVLWLFYTKQTSFRFEFKNKK